MADNDPSLRCSDADREKVVDQLREHYAAGRLTLEEFQERSDVAYGAKTFGDLSGLTTDLPATVPEVAKPDKPTRRSNAALRGAWGSWASVSAVMVVIWLLTVVSSGHLSHFWPMWVIGPWGVLTLMGTFGGRYRQRDKDDEQGQVGHDERHRRQLDQHEQRAQMRFDRASQRRRDRQERRNHFRREVG